MNEWMLSFEDVIYKENLYKMLLIKAKIDIIQSKLIHNLIIIWQICGNTYKIK